VVIPMVVFFLFLQLFCQLKILSLSRHDIRDEFKECEGDPHVKGKIRQMPRAAAQRRLMDGVPNADVMVTNPRDSSV
ncbi:EscU/YscU/HrcU family type III secretion system export apparatus switch protein, partial [Salmonella enterica subsp. enterica serovar Infantis]